MDHGIPQRTIPGAPVRPGLGISLVVLTIAALAGRLAAQDPSDFDDRLAAARGAWHEQLELLANQCEQQAMAAEAGQVRQAIIARDPSRQYIFLPPDHAPPLPPGATESQAAWHQQFLELGRAHAARLVDLARIAAAESRGAAAYQLLHEALAANPDEPELRRMLGYRRDPQNRWVKTARPVRISPGRTRQKIIGWDKESYQIIQSPHFTVYSSDDEAGVQLAQQLERTWNVWRQVYFDHWCSVRQLQSWLNGKGSDASGSRRHDVILFRDRSQYLADLGEVEGVELSAGYYNENRRASFFYNDTPVPLSTWRHEIVHQLLQETVSGQRSVAELGHAWLVEGIAMYFESLRDHGNYVTLGGFDATRLQTARLRFTREGFFVPLEELDSLGRIEFQQSPDIHALYSQSAGLCQFLLVADNARYRDPLIAFIGDFYQGRAGQNGLASAIGPLDQIDRQYRQFLKVDPNQVRQIRPAGQTGLALAQSGIRGEDLAGLDQCQSLEWLQLSGNPLDDDGLKHLVSLPRLTQLMIDLTAITDAGLETVATLKSLEELDVAHTRISDAGLAAITRLPALEVLWLSGTAVTDAGLQHLESLSNLQYLDLRQTGVTGEGIARLREKLPDLEIAR